MTWSTESIGSSANKQNKNVTDHCHYRKRFTIKSRRPSFRHHVTLSRSRHYSTSATHCKNNAPPRIDLFDQVPSCELEGQNESSDANCCNISQKCEILRRSPFRRSSPGRKAFRSKEEMISRCSEMSADCAVSSSETDASGDELSSPKGEVYSVQPSVPIQSLGSELNGAMVEKSDLSIARKENGEGNNDVVTTRGVGTEYALTSEGNNDIVATRGVGAEYALTSEDLGPKISVIQDDWNVEVAQGSQSAYEQHVECRDDHIESTPNSTCTHEVEKEQTDKGSMKASRTNVVKRTISNRNRFTLRRQVPLSSGSSNRSRKTRTNSILRPKSSSEEANTSTASVDEFKEESISLNDIPIEFKSPTCDSEDSAEEQIDPPTETITPSNELTSISSGYASHDRSLQYREQMIHSNYRRFSRARKICMYRRARKILILGDMTSGKSNLISAYCKDRFTKEYTPTYLNCCKTDAKICGENIDLVVIEISGRDDFEPLRRRAYHKIDAVIFCYPVDNILSFERVKKFWVPELRKYTSKAPFVLVGTKKDLRDEAQDEKREIERELTKEKSDVEMAGRLRVEAEFRGNFVSQERGKHMAHLLGAAGFYECSSLYRDTTREIFENVTKTAMQKTRRKRRVGNRHLDTTCNIL